MWKTPDLVLQCYPPVMTPVRVLGPLVFAVIAYPCLAVASAQVNQRGSESLIACDNPPQSLTPYGFAMATLNSLWQANAATLHATSQTATPESRATPSALLTAMMRGTKLSTNDYICARQAVAPFAAKQARWQLATLEQQENLRIAAAALAKIYDIHISLNDRVLYLLRSKTPFDSVEFSDKISTLQVEREENWSQLTNPVTIVLLSLIDLRATDENGTFIHSSDPSAGYTRRLTITKQQKEEILVQLRACFPNLSNATPKDQWTMPESLANAYTTLFENHLCSNE